jgi:hypothetical protein
MDHVLLCNEKRRPVALRAGLPAGAERHCSCRRRRPPAGPSAWVPGLRWKAAHSARPRTRTEIMPRLSDTQAVLLAAAAARGDLSVLPPPETVRLKGAALDRTLRAPHPRPHRRGGRRRSAETLEVGRAARQPRHPTSRRRSGRQRGSRPLPSCRSATCVGPGWRPGQYPFASAPIGRAGA